MLNNVFMPVVNETRRRNVSSIHPPPIIVILYRVIKLAQAKVSSPEKSTESHIDTTTIHTYVPMDNLE